MKRATRWRLLRRMSLIVMGAICISAFLFLYTKIVNKKSADETRTALQGIDYTETITPNAYGNFLAAAVKSFYTGGSTNGVTVSAHNYYPSTADIADKKWTRKNIPLGNKIDEMIANGSLTYESKGCDAARPSSRHNACSEFVIRSEGEIVFDSER